MLNYGCVTKHLLTSHDFGRSILLIPEPACLNKHIYIHIHIYIYIYIYIWYIYIYMIYIYMIYIYMIYIYIGPMITRCYPSITCITICWVNKGSLTSYDLGYHPGARVLTQLAMESGWKSSWIILIIHIELIIIRGITNRIHGNDQSNTILMTNPNGS